MTTETENIKTWTTHDPTRKDLIFAPPAFFCFSAIAQMAHLQNRPSRPTTLRRINKSTSTTLLIKADTSVLLSIRCSAIPVFVGGLI
jgi:hypothetical protein